MPDFEYTVTEDFTMRLSDDGAIKSFRVGDHISDPMLVSIVEESHPRQVARHYLRPVIDAPMSLFEQPADERHDEA